MTVHALGGFALQINKMPFDRALFEKMLEGQPSPVPEFMRAHLDQLTNPCYASFADFLHIMGEAWLKRPVGDPFRRLAEGDLGKPIDMEAYETHFLIEDDSLELFEDPGKPWNKHLKPVTLNEILGAKISHIVDPLTDDIAEQCNIMIYNKNTDNYRITGEIDRPLFLYDGKRYWASKNYRVPQLVNGRGCIIVPEKVEIVHELSKIHVVDKIQDEGQLTITDVAYLAEKGGTSYVKQYTKIGWFTDTYNRPSEDATWDGLVPIHRAGTQYIPFCSRLGTIASIGSRRIGNGRDFPLKLTPEESGIQPPVIKPESLAYICCRSFVKAGKGSQSFLASVAQSKCLEVMHGEYPIVPDIFENRPDGRYFAGVLVIPVDCDTQSLKYDVKADRREVRLLVPKPLDKAMLLVLGFDWFSVVEIDSTAESRTKDIEFKLTDQKRHPYWHLWAVNP
jgi:hypothetical protein